MQLSEEAVIEFQKLYKKECGQAISREQAIDYGMKLIDLVKLVYGSHIPKSLNKSLDDRKKEAYHNYGHN